MVGAVPRIALGEAEGMAIARHSAEQNDKGVNVAKGVVRMDDFIVGETLRRRVRRALSKILRLPARVLGRGQGIAPTAPVSRGRGEGACARRFKGSIGRHAKEVRHALHRQAGLIRQGYVMPVKGRHGLVLSFIADEARIAAIIIGAANSKGFAHITQEGRAIRQGSKVASRLTGIFANIATSKGISRRLTSIGFIVREKKVAIPSEEEDKITILGRAGRSGVNVPRPISLGTGLGHNLAFRRGREGIWQEGGVGSEKVQAVRVGRRVAQRKVKKDG